MDIEVLVSGTGESVMAVLHDGCGAEVYSGACSAAGCSEEDCEVVWLGEVVDRRGVNPGIAAGDVVCVRVSPKVEARMWLEEQGVAVDADSVKEHIEGRRWDVVRVMIVARVCSERDVPLLIAYGDLDSLRMFLDVTGMDVNSPLNEMGMTALHFACSHSQEPIVSYLLSVNSNVHATQCTGQTPLHLAATQGCLHICELLLSHGANPNAANRYNETPLHHAALRGHASIVALLLRAGSDANVRSTAFTKETPLHCASKQRFDNVIAMLIEAGANTSATNLFGDTPNTLYERRQREEATHIVYPKMLTLYVTGPLVEGSLTVSAGGDDTLLEVKGNIAAALKVEADMFALMHEGVELERMEARVAETALCEGDEVEARPSRQMAAKGGLHALGLECSLVELQSVMVSCRPSEEKAAIMHLMIEADPAFAMSRGDDGVTPLHLAARAGFADIVRVLLKLPGLPDVPRERPVPARCMSPLHMASRDGHLETVSVLLDEGGISPNTTNNIFAYSPMHLASWNGHTAVVQKLLDAGGNPNAAANNGFTPLHIAAQEGNNEIVTLLLSSGASAAAAATNGKLPIHCAEEMRHDGTAALLR